MKPVACNVTKQLLHNLDPCRNFPEGTFLKFKQAQIIGVITIAKQARSCAKIMVIGDYNSDIEKGPERV